MDFGLKMVTKTKWCMALAIIQGKDERLIYVRIERIWYLHPWAKSHLRLYRRSRGQKQFDIFLYRALNLFILSEDIRSNSKADLSGSPH